MESTKQDAKKQAQEKRKNQQEKQNREQLPALPNKK
jgi:hypothetical protein